MDDEHQKDRPKSAANGRERNVRFVTWMTCGEREEVASKAREAGMTQADFVLESARGVRVFARKDDEKIALLLEIRHQLSRAGNNLNQIARTLNSANRTRRSDIVDAELDSIDEAVARIRSALFDLAEAIEKERMA